jgi:hypothetical protein
LVLEQTVIVLYSALVGSVASVGLVRHLTSASLRSKHIPVELIRSVFVLKLMHVTSGGGGLFSLAAEIGTKRVRINPNKTVEEIFDLETLPSIRKG